MQILHSGLQVKFFILGGAFVGNHVLELEGDESCAVALHHHGVGLKALLTVSLGSSATLLLT